MFFFKRIQFLSRCDEVVYMDEGRIKDQGPHTVLIDRNEEYSTLINTFLNVDDDELLGSAVSEDPKENDGAATERLSSLRYCTNHIY